VIVLPGGAMTVVPPGPGATTVLGEALGAGAGTTTVPPGWTVTCARAAVTGRASRPSPRSAAVIPLMTVLPLDVRVGRHRPGAFVRNPGAAEADERCLDRAPRRGYGGVPVTISGRRPLIDKRVSGEGITRA
jgi:hypothetical protein